MSLKQFQTIKIITAVVVAMLVAQFVVTRNYIGPVIGVAIAMAVLLYFRSRVKEVIADERDIAIGGKSARWAMQVSCWVAIVVMLVLLAKQDINPIFPVIAQTLAYSSCFLMFTYSVIFQYLQKYEKPN